MTVSIIIPVYQVTDYVERCIQSVINQTYTDIECIIVDDCSTDDSIAKCELLIGSYQGPIKFKILHHEVNRGLSASRNTGTKEATGEYIYYLDSDDEITNDCIEKLIKPVMIYPSIEIVMGNYQRYAVGCTIGTSERVTLSLQEKYFDSNRTVREFYYGNGLWQAAWNKLINRDFLLRNGLYFKEGAIWEDTLWLFYVVKYLRHLYTIPDVIYHYTKRPGALTTGMVDGGNLLHQWCVIYDEIVTHLTECERGREAKYHMQGLCYRSIDNPDNKEFREVAGKYVKVLCDEKLLIDCCLLKIIAFASRFKLGRKAFYYAANKLKTTTKS